ncbi:GNAT family N-acetyltransferase [Enemella sp. A6]|uniref:GNAT family N-acetyltransferase n=1 Tax=Enemella sp. A6 TaxID=3440152 RepID=UPI003EB9515F
MTIDEQQRTGVSVLGTEHLEAAVRLLSSQPVENVFVASRVRSGGLDPFLLGCQVWGYWEDGELVSMLHAGSNFVPINATPAALDAFIEYAGPVRKCSSIVGPAPVAMSLWRGLCQRWGGSWVDAREVRARQPLMTIDTDPPIAGDPRVRRIGLEHWDAYVEAAIAMYTEEVGVSPVLGNNSTHYRYYVRQLIESGRSYGWVNEHGQVLFKSDIGSAARQVCQVQGVWLHPELRGTGIAAGLMAQVVILARQEFPVVSLYVNDFNERARATYRRCGFDEVGEFATILY